MNKKKRAQKRHDEREAYHEYCLQHRREEEERLRKEEFELHYYDAAGYDA